MFGRGTDGYRQLFGVAYRVLGSAHDAEDAVQEGFARWQDLTQQQRDLVRQPIAWLTRVVSRICLDQLGSARARRETYTGIWLPETLLGTSTHPPVVQQPPSTRQRRSALTSRYRWRCWSRWNSSRRPNG